MSENGTRYEVLFKTGDGSWRRWRLCDTLAAAERSHDRLKVHMGDHLVRLGSTRIVKRSS